MAVYSGMRTSTPRALAETTAHAAPEWAGEQKRAGMNDSHSELGRTLWFTEGITREVPSCPDVCQPGLMRLVSAPVWFERRLWPPM